MGPAEGWPKAGSGCEHAPAGRVARPAAPGHRRRYRRLGPAARATGRTAGVFWGGGGWVGGRRWRCGSVTNPASGRRRATPGRCARFPMSYVREAALQWVRLGVRGTKQGGRRQKRGLRRIELRTSSKLVWVDPFALKKNHTTRPKSQRVDDIRLSNPVYLRSRGSARHPLGVVARQPLVAASGILQGRPCGRRASSAQCPPPLPPLPHPQAPSLPPPPPAAPIVMPEKSWAWARCERGGRRVCHLISGARRTRPGEDCCSPKVSRSSCRHARWSAGSAVRARGHARAANQASLPLQSCSEWA